MAAHPRTRVSGIDRASIPWAAEACCFAPASYGTALVPHWYLLSTA